MILCPTLTVDFPQITENLPESARVLVSPEHRGTFLDQQWDPSLPPPNQKDLDFDQVSYALPTANGKALQVLDTYSNFDQPFQDLLTVDFISGCSTSNTFMGFSGLGGRIPQDLSVPSQEGVIELDGMPLIVKYSIESGQLIIDESSIKNIVRRLGKKWGVKSDELPDFKSITDLVNSALSGDKKDENKLLDLIKKFQP